MKGRITHTHTFALLEVSAEAFDEIKQKLTDADYKHCFIDNAIELSGIGLVRGSERPQVTNYAVICICPKDGRNNRCPMHGDPIPTTITSSSSPENGGAGENGGLLVVDPEARCSCGHQMAWHPNGYCTMKGCPCFAATTAELPPVAAALESQRDQADGHRRGATIIAAIATSLLTGCSSDNLATAMRVVGFLLMAGALMFCAIYGMAWSIKTILTIADPWSDDDLEDEPAQQLAPKVES